MEYRRAGGAGPCIICRSCAMEGGRGLSAVDFSTIWTLMLLGLVASFAFSCSNRARRSAVDCGFCQHIDRWRCDMGRRGAFTLSVSSSFTCSSSVFSSCSQFTSSESSEASLSGP